MDNAKKAAFVRAMGKNRLNMAKGGKLQKLKRKYFDTGGTALSGPGASGSVDSSTNPNTGFLGNINGALGLNNQFEGQAANIQAGTNAAQLNDAYTGVQGALNQQQGLTTALNPQVGTAVGNQNALANQYLAMSQGQGPNPALAQLAQTTGQNVANQSAEAAGQRGASSNVGLLERQAAQTGAATQQAAAGQAATTEAQQQIAAQNNLANLSNNQISQAGQATTGLNSAQQNEQSILQNANTSLNNANVAMQSNLNNVNSQTSAANQNMAANTLGAIGSAASSLLAKGGVVEKPHHLKLAEMNAVSLKHGMKHFDDGGEVEDQPNLGTFHAGDDSASSPNVASSSSLPADQTDLSKAFAAGGGGGGGGGGMSGLSSIAALFSKGGPVQNFDQGAGPIQAMPMPNQNLMLAPTQTNGPGTWASNYMNSGPMPNQNLMLAPTKINGPGTWASNYMNSGQASSPNVAGTSGLPQNTTNFSKAFQKKNQQDKKSKTYNPSDEDQEQQTMEADEELSQPSTAGTAQGPVDENGNKPKTDQENYQDTTNDLDQPAQQGGAAVGEDMTTAYKGGRMYNPKHFHEYFSGGGKVPAMVSPGEIYLSPEKVRQVLSDGIDPKKIGEKIPGKAKVKGDSLKNDVVPKTLEEGGVVIDRKNMSTREKRELFVHKAMARKRAGK